MACHCGDSDAEVEEMLGTVSGAVFNKLIIFMLREVLAQCMQLMRYSCGWSESQTERGCGHLCTCSW